ncbi:MAG: hypothetical protein M2R45_03676 [Verrucomicrobia subdivision 3 bacterium]|nr:hypothetical protein [Limisphaerales bacterium]MCS1414959.1 hypothetical protein [Limisphaerales bacterium]
MKLVKGVLIVLLHHFFLLQAKGGSMVCRLYLGVPHQIEGSTLWSHEPYGWVVDTSAAFCSRERVAMPSRAKPSICSRAAVPKVVFSPVP